MTPQIDGHVKAERARHLADLECELRGEFFQQLVGRSLGVLVESGDEDDRHQFLGTSCRYAPVGVTRVPSASNSQPTPPSAPLLGQLVDCVPHAFDGRYLQARLGT